MLNFKLILDMLKEILHIKMNKLCDDISLNTTTMYHQMILDYRYIIPLYREMRMGNKRRTNNFALWSISIKLEEREEEKNSLLTAHKIPFNNQNE